jgi:hypothetical protein
MIRVRCDLARMSDEWREAGEVSTYLLDTREAAVAKRRKR